MCHCIYNLSNHDNVIHTYGRCFGEYILYISFISMKDYRYLEQKDHNENSHESEEYNLPENVIHIFSGFRIGQLTT